MFEIRSYTEYPTVDPVTYVATFSDAGHAGTIFKMMVADIKAANPKCEVIRESALFFKVYFPATNRTQTITVDYAS